MTHQQEPGKNVVVLGATPKEDRYANIAMQRLQRHGYRPIPVNPAFEEILGERCYRSIADVPQPIDTVTMYVGAARSTPLIPEIVAAKPRRIVFNPGAENAELASEAEKNGIEMVEGCTLVMLGAGTF
jgi:predicted CoA-binding protein